MTKQDAPPIYRATDFGEASVACPRDEPPVSDAITDYDEAHFATYMHLLYGKGEGYSFAQLARDVFDIDANKEPARAIKMVSTHLRRANWLCEEGLRHFLTPTGPS